MVDMELDDTLKLRVATRLLDQSAATLWENLKLRTTIPVTWELFVREFNDQYYTRFHRDQKRQEFFRLRQWGKSMTEYETELRQLAEFVPEMAGSEEYLCSKFEKGLNLEIREKMSVSGNQSYKEMVQLALRAKKLANEKGIKGKFQKRKGFGFTSGQTSKKSKSSESSGNSSGSGAESVNSPRIF